MALKSTTTTTATLLLLVGCVVLQGAAGQGAAGQGQGQRRDVCFPGEGDLQQLPPDPNFPPTVERFSYEIFDQISRGEGERSVMMSPYSIWSVLSVAYFGAMGVTQREMEDVLNYVNKTHTLSNWNALRFFLESGAGEATLNVANRGYFSNQLDMNNCLTSNLFDLHIVDFTKAEAARQAINQDVNITTQGRIPELITFLPPSTRFALVNAIFFKGSWHTKFDPKQTRPQEFLIPPGRSSGVVQMMNRLDAIVAGEAAGLDAKMVELPYKDSNISMFLLLPNDPLAPTTALTARLNAASFATAVRSLPKTPTFVELSVPKFKLSTRYEQELKQSLGALGISSLFDARRANLQGFASPASPLFVDTAIHQATVEVNEEGTVAAAATGLINTRIGPQVPQVIAFNRPFVFLIVEKRTRIPLFMGKVTSAADLEEL